MFRIVKFKQIKELAAKLPKPKVGEPEVVTVLRRMAEADHGDEFELTCSADLLELDQPKEPETLSD